MLLPIVILAVLEGAFSATCPAGFAPTKTAIRRLNGMESPLSWHDIDWQCTAQFPGYEMLKRDFTKLSRAERKLCGNEMVPLGLVMKRYRSKPIWRGAYDLQHEDEVSQTYLKYKKPTTAPEDSSLEWRGALNLETLEWWLVPHNATFRCALCQRARRGQLNKFWANQRPEPFTRAYTAVVDNIFFGQMKIEMFVNFIQEVFDKENASIFVDENSTFLLDGKRKYSMRLRSAKQLISDDVQSLLQGFDVSSWKDMDLCPNFTSPLLNSTSISIGKVASSQLPGKSDWISRDCIWKFREGNDFDAVWDKPLLWVRIMRECLANQPKEDGYPSVLHPRNKRHDAGNFNLTAQHP